MIKPIYVVWQDACSDDSWNGPDDGFEDPHTIHTLGFLVFEDKAKIVVAQNIDMNKMGRSMEISIPTAWILKKKLLKLEKPKKTAKTLPHGR